MRKLIFFLLLNFFISCHAAESQKFTVILDWFVNPNHAPLFVAQEQGFFKQQDLDVDLIGPANPADPPKLVAAGKADVAITYEPKFMQQVDHGLPLIRIGTLIDKPLDCLVVLKQSSIQSIKDLRGKTIGYSNGDTNGAILNVMLKKNNLSLDDVKTIDVYYSLTQALLAKKVDAITGVMRNFELIQLELAGHPGRAFYPEQNGVPSYSELIFVARKDKINDIRYQKFLIALKKGVDYLQKHPETSWQAFIKSHPELNNKLNQQAWLITLPYFATDPTTFDAKNWEEFAKFMFQNGLIKKVQPIDRYSIIL